MDIEVGFRCVLSDHKSVRYVRLIKVIRQLSFNTVLKQSAHDNVSM